MSLVSVVMPMYNAEQTVGASLRSLQAQDLADFEAIVVDDGSTDDGAQIVRAIRNADPRVKLIHQTNAGVSAARNLATREARGEYLYWLDPDDLCEPGALGALVQGAEQSGLGAAAGHHDVVNAQGELLHAYHLMPRQLGLCEQIDGWSTRCGAHVVRRSLITQGSEPIEWDESLSLWEDRDYWIRLAERGVRWDVIDLVVTRYVVREGSLSKRALGMMQSGDRVLRDVFGRHSGEEGFGQARLETMLTRSVLSSASRAAAISGDGGAAFEAMREKTACTSWSDLELADAGRFGVIYGCGVCPDVRTKSQNWARGLDSLWISMGLDTQHRREVWGCLARLSITPQQIAKRLLDRCEGAGGVVVVGYGHNGRAVVREAGLRGIRVRVRDDVGVTGDLESEAMGAPVPPGWGVVVTPFEEGSLRARFEAFNTVFASDLRRELLEERSWDPAASVGESAPC